jgi:hypothetical protein
LRSKQIKHSELDLSRINPQNSPVYTERANRQSGLALSVFEVTEVGFRMLYGIWVGGFVTGGLIGAGCGSLICGAAVFVAGALVELAGAAGVGVDGMDVLITG